MQIPPTVEQGTSRHTSVDGEPSYDPCLHRASLNLDTEDDCVKVLLRDKTQRLEGVCVEYLLEDDLLRQGGWENFSSGWWMIKNGNNPLSFMMFKIVPEEGIPAEDVGVLEYFVRRRVQCHCIRYNTPEQSFYATHANDNIQLLRDGNPPARIFTQADAYFNRIKMKNQFPPVARDRDLDRQRQAIAFIRERGRLKRAALDRLLANCFLSRYFYAVWDIDAFVFDEGRLRAFEVKQKYPAPEEYLGVNTELGNMLAWIASHGIPVHHIVLTKPIWDWASPALEILQNKELSSKSLWIGKTFEGPLDYPISTSPRRTSLYGTSRLDFFKVPVTEFSIIKILFDEDNRLADFLRGELEQINNINQIPRIIR